MDKRKILFGVILLIFLMGFSGATPVGARMVKEICITLLFVQLTSHLFLTIHYVCCGHIDLPRRQIFR